tara:strand:- start:312 stop:503 length:192 start_codon:yes stop_codon:yes gene_type:complete
MAYDFTLTMRCDSEELSDFKHWCKKANKDHQDVLREIIQSAPEGRLKIVQSEEEKESLKEIYE